MSNTPTPHSPRREMFLVFFGAAISLLSSLLTSYFQGRSELDQLIFEKKIEALRSYASTYNESITKALAAIDAMRFKLNHAIQTLSLGADLSPEQEKELENIGGELNQLAAKISSASGDRILLYATFKEDFADLSISQSKDAPDLELSTPQWQNEPDPDKKAQLRIDALRDADAELRRLGADIQEKSTRMNKRLPALAKTVRE